MRTRTFYIMTMLFSGILGTHAQIWLEDDPFPSIADPDTAEVVTLSASAGRGSVVKKTFHDSDGMMSSTAICYTDGFGRPSVMIMAGCSPAHDDWVNLQEYDALGRKTQSWLTTVSCSGNGNYVSTGNVKTMSCQQYNDTAPFSSVEYEPSPVGRVAHQFGAGLYWRNAGKKTILEYPQCSPETPWLRCIAYTVIVNPEGSCQITANGVFPTGSVLAVKMIDEDGHTLYEFYDRSNRKLLSRQMEGSLCHDTYYVYDGLGNLQAVLPPAFSVECSSGTASQNLINDYAYLYHYDGRNRLVAKKLPGCGWQWMEYDTGDRLVFTQDARQRTEGKSTFHLYDKLGRECVTGTCSRNVGSGISSHVTCFYSGSSGQLMGYGAENIVLTDARPLVVHYYDSYEFAQNKDSLSFQVYEEYADTNAFAHGMLTGRAVLRLSGNTQDVYDFESYYYDDRGRLIQSRAMNQLNGTDVNCTQHSFTNQPLKTLHRHTRGNGSVITEEYNYEYDHADRLLSVVYSLNGCAPVTLSEYTYDDIGRVATKTVGGSETINYHYNIRNWTTEIIGSKFMERLAYNQIVNDLSPGMPCYNGNIAAMLWAVQGDALRGYRFTYDGLNRLETACYGEGPYLHISTGRYDEAATYDCMGNMTAFDRYGRADNGDYGLIDGLEYTYDGNHVVKITDWDEYTPTVKDAFHFHDGANVDVEYEYDENGNMTKDLNRGFLSIEYNLLNLPQLIEYQYGRAMKFTYDATGRKLKAEETLLMQPLPFPHFLNTPLNLYGHGLSGDQPQSHPRDSLVTVLPPDSTMGHSVNHGGLINYIFVINYCGNIIYDCNQRIVQNPEGYATLAADGTPTFHYYVRDHLGSVRVVFNEQDSIEQANHYYPWGGLMAVSTGGDAQRYKFCGKELIRDHGIDWYDHGARWYDATAPTWHTMDPLCEKTPSVTPYMYCHGNPVRLIDPNGEYDFENTIQPNTSYNVIAVFPSNYYEDKSLRKHHNETIKHVPVVLVDDITDYVAAMSALKEMRSSTELYTLNSHGLGGDFDNPAYFYIGNDKVNYATNFEQMTEGLKDKIVFICACDVGSLQGFGTDLVENMSNATQSTVISSSHPIPVGYKYDGGYGLNDTRPLRSHGDDYNQYMYSHNGSTASIIRDVRIDAIIGIFWNDYQGTSCPISFNGYFFMR